jgi:hypothetical protein
MYASTASADQRRSSGEEFVCVQHVWRRKEKWKEMGWLLGLFGPTRLCNCALCACAWCRSIDWELNQRPTSLTRQTNNERFSSGKLKRGERIRQEPSRLEERSCGCRRTAAAGNKGRCGGRRHFFSLKESRSQIPMDPVVDFS